MSSQENSSSAVHEDVLAEKDSKDLGTVPEVQIELPLDEPETASQSAEASSEANDQGDLDNLMMADFEKAAALPRGQVVECKVLKITDSEVFVDVGMKNDAAVPISEFQSDDGTLAVEAGQTIALWVENYNEKQGTVTVSRRKAARIKLWEGIEHAFKEQSIVTGKVVERVKGGLAVDIGVKAFLPSSHADIHPMRNPDSLLGQQIPVKIIKYTRKRENIVVSRKLVLEEEANRLKAVLLEKIHEGAELTGRVKNLTDYGAFLDLGGLDGLLHITDLAWHRVKHPSEVVAVGQDLTVKVLKFDPEKGRVSLGLKQLSPDPWESATEQFHPGDRVRGRVVSLTDYGAFIELAPGIEGLIHISEMTWSKKLKHPSKVLKKDDEVEAAVLEVKPAERRLSLSLRQTLPNPWTSFAERCTVGSEVEAVVRNMTDFGAFVEIEPGVEGLVHVSDLSWTKKVKHPSEILKKGQKVKAVILRMEVENRRLSLGLKQLETDPWETFLAGVKVGDLVHGKVMRLAPFGAFVELVEGVEGLCHNSEVGNAKTGNDKGGLEVGSEHEFRVTRLSGTEKKIGLSMKDAVERPAPPASVKSAKRAAEPRKEPERMTTMAAAFSSAGITARMVPPTTMAPSGEEEAAQEDRPASSGN
jgi:small subunit ribosomal protein S1